MQNTMNIVMSIALNMKMPSFYNLLPFSFSFFPFIIDNSLYSIIII